MSMQSPAVAGILPECPDDGAASSAAGFPRSSLLAVGLAVLAVAALSMQTVDVPLARYMKLSVTGETAVFFRAVSNFGFGTGYIVTACAGLLIGALARRFDLPLFWGAGILRLQRHCAHVLLSLAASGAIVNLAKVLLDRHRPRDLFADGAFGFEPFSFHHGLNSFPSGHSQTIFAVATVVALAMPRRVWPVMLWAAMVAASRVIMTNHYLSDVLVGSYVGIAAALAIAPSVLVDRSTLLPPKISLSIAGFFRRCQKTYRATIKPPISSTMNMTESSPK